MAGMDGHLGSFDFGDFSFDDWVFDHDLDSNDTAASASGDADIPADQSLGGMGGADEDTDGSSEHDTPNSVRTGYNTMLADSSASNNTLPAPMASNKRCHDAQDGAEDQRPAQRRATTSVAALTVEAPLSPLPLGPTPTIERERCQTASPPQRHWNASAENANRQGKRPGWAQAKKHHMANCEPFVAGGCHGDCELRKKFPETSRRWDGQRFLIEWRDNKQQEIVNGFFIDAESRSPREFMVCGELDVNGAIHKKLKKVSCWDAFNPSA